MSVLKLAQAKAHLREVVVDTNNDALIEAYLDAAEDYAAAYLGRYFYIDQPALDAAKAAAPDQLQQALDAAVAQGETISDGGLPCDYRRDERYRLNPRTVSDRAKRDAETATFLNAVIAAKENYRMTMSGIVINPSIRSACLLQLGHLYNNRESVVDSRYAVELPLGARHLLDLYRAGLGV